MSKGLTIAEFKEKIGKVAEETRERGESREGEKPFRQAFCVGRAIDYLLSPEYEAGRWTAGEK